MIDQPLPKYEGGIPKIIAEEVPQEEVVHGRTLPPMGSESGQHQLKPTYSSDGDKSNAVHTQPSATLGKAIEGIQTTISPLSPSAPEPRETALLEIDGKTSDAQAPLAPSLPHVVETHETTLSDPPSTPVWQIDRGFQSPLSKDQTATP